MNGFTRAPGLLVDELGDGWVAYSPLSGISHLLNDSSAAILEILGDSLPMTASEVCRVLADDVERPCEEIERAVHGHWSDLVGGGLIREHCARSR